MSLRNLTAERRRLQNACVWQTWQGYSLRVFLWSSLKLMFSGILQKELFKGGCSSPEMFFQKNYCHAYHTRFATFFPFPSCCVSLLLATERERQLTTARANQTTGLTNGRAVNWPPEVASRPFRALSCRQLTFPFLGALLLNQPNVAFGPGGKQISCSVFR